MDSEHSSYRLENEKQFWDELQVIVNTPCSSQTTIDNCLKAFLGFTSTFADEHLTTDYDWARCAYSLLEGPLFLNHKSYVRRRMIGRLRKEHANARVHLVMSVLLFEGRQNKKVFENMLEEGLFQRLVQLVADKRDEDRYLWGVALDLLYEMSRMQRLRPQDIESIDENFVKYLLQVVEDGSDDPDDPYHYRVIRMLLVLNEQYMLCAHSTPPNPDPANTPPNLVINVLCAHGPEYKTFGENIIYLINRESEVSLQLLILKLLYLLFTTKATYQYFYSNDLRVLVDVIIRNLLDLPDEAQSLRHTYLRVLYPLLFHSQLKEAPHYKCDELRNVFNVLCGCSRSEHFEPADATTVRLVARCQTIPWLQPPPEPEPEPEPGPEPEPEPQQNPKRTKRLPPPPPPPRAATVAHKLLGMSLGHRGESSLSVVEVAAQSEKPGVMMPSRSRGRPPPSPAPRPTKSNGTDSPISSAQGNGVEIAGEA